MVTALQEFGLKDDAVPDEVKKKYYELAQVHHPDKGGKQDDFNRLVVTYKKALTEASAPKPCPSCKGKGKICQTNGFDTVNIICHQCGGGGKL